MEKQVFEIKTENDSQLTVQSCISTTSITNVTSDEIAISISWYEDSPESFNQHVLISKQECRRLIKVLELLSL